MVDRLRMDATGLKISKPGIAVSSATPSQLLLDTNRVMQVWHSAIHARPASFDPFNIFKFVSYPYPELPYIPCAQLQVYAAGQWRQGLNVDLIGIALGVSVKTYSFYWTTTSAAASAQIDYIRVTIFNVRGQA